MLGLDTLDVAIGLVFVYLMVSFVCSAAVELVEVVLKNRPKKLLQGITELLGHSDEWVKKIYSDPLVNALYKGKFSEQLPAKELPSYIPSRNFALAVLNQVPGVSGNASWDQLSMAVNGFFSDADKTKLAELRNAGGNKAEILALEAKEQVGTALKSALLTAEKDVDKAVRNIEDWYNSSMDRVSGWFKRRTQYILLAFGAICAAVYNIDTIDIVARLAQDKAVRAAVIASAGATITEAATSTAPPAAASKPEQKTPPAASGGGATATPPNPAGQKNEDVAAAKDRLAKAIDKLQGTGLPIGWGPKPEFHCAWIWPSLRLHGLGWLLTAIAVSFGAPFWFDVLNKFMVVRSTVKPKEKSGPEKSKDA